MTHLSVPYLSFHQSFCISLEKTIANALALKACPICRILPFTTDTQSKERICSEKKKRARFPSPLTNFFSSLCESSACSVSCGECVVLVHTRRQPSPVNRLLSNWP